MIVPEAKQAAVTRALLEAFGVQEVEDIRLLTGGLSPTLVFRIVVAGQPYLLRLIMREGAFSDPTPEFTCMTVAAEAGIAPRIWYADVEDRVLITDFVTARPYPDDMALRIAPTIRRLHALPQFPPPKMGNYLDTMDGLVRRFQAARLLPESVTEELFRGYNEVKRVYPHGEAELVASHNDLNPRNILFDWNRLWLVDWEAAFLNDPYVALARVSASH